MEYPIPKHLREIFIVDEEQSDMNSIWGYIVCSCGCDSFGLKAYCEELENGTVGIRDDIEDGKMTSDSTIFVSKRFAFALGAVCSKCGKDHLIADLSSLGYDGLVCEDFRSVKPNEFEPYHCAKCSRNNFRLRIFYEAEDQEQFIEEVVTDMPDRFSPDDYVDSIFWLCVDIKCGNCGHYVNNWFDIELA